MNRSQWNKLAGAAVLLLALFPHSLQACSACYGQSDSPLANGMNWGIMTLLAVVLCVLTGITTFFVYIAKRSPTDKTP
jgi:hypothetical protein